MRNHKKIETRRQKLQQIKLLASIVRAFTIIQLEEIREGKFLANIRAKL